VNTTILQGFVVLEGLDGSGTTTQMRLLGERLKRAGAPFVTTCEPTDGPVGKLIRSILRRGTQALPQTIALLFAADRSEHVNAPEVGIAAHAIKGEAVICDRYLFSSLAYQSLECGMEYVIDLNAGFPLPQCLVFLDTPVNVCQERLSRRRSPELYDGSSFQSRVRDGYLRAIERFHGSGMRVDILDGDRPADLINGEIWKIVSVLPITRV
jgi:dTMP kinase